MIGIGICIELLMPIMECTVLYVVLVCAHALDHLSEVIIVGGNQEAVRRMGFRSATTLQDAFEIASQIQLGLVPPLRTTIVPPILMADVT